MKKRALFFTQTNAVLLKEEDIDPKIKNLILNPDLSYVRGVPPHHYKMMDGKIVPMNQEEREQREMLIHELGVISKPEFVDAIEEELKKDKEFKSIIVYKQNLLLMLTIALVAMCVGAFIMKYYGRM